MSHRNGRTKHQVLEYGREQIPYELSFSERKRLTIHVEPDQSVKVLAPSDVTLEQVKSRVQRRAGWIVRQRHYFEDFVPTPPPKRYVEGETHRYLGRQYRLKFSKGESKSVKLRGRYFELTNQSRPSSSDVECLLEAWYRERAQLLLHKKVEDALTTSFLRTLDTPSMQVRKMKSRWGSCTQGGDIIFNLALIKAPLECIEYVVVHELCHLKVHDHSRRYYDLLTKCMPDWERRKKRLNSQDWERS